MLNSDRKLVETPDQSNGQTNTQTSDIIIQNLKKLTVCTLLSSELAAKHILCEPTASSLVVRLREC